MITNGKKVEQGTSGGISLIGTLAALAGATLVGFAAVASEPGENWLRRLVIIALGGLIGSLFDSLLGATVQAIYWCPTCNKETERHPNHTCGSPTSRIRGWSWINNDVVNLACSLMGAVVATAVWQLL
jgi:uncharacterized membrane protein